MTQNEIIEMARQAGGIDMTNTLVGNFTAWIGTGTNEFLERFAKLVAQHERERLTDAAMKAAEKAVDVAIALEREACAEVCIAQMQGKSIWMEGARACSLAIRARGQA